MKVWSYDLLSQDKNEWYATQVLGTQEGSGEGTLGVTQKARGKTDMHFGRVRGENTVKERQRDVEDTGRDAMEAAQ